MPSRRFVTLESEGPLSLGSFFNAGIHLRRDSKEIGTQQVLTRFLATYLLGRLRELNCENSLTASDGRLLSGSTSITHG